jgi:adenylate cyclase
LERKLTAILCTDVFGYSRLMEEDEEATLRTLSAYRKIIDQLIENHRGRFVNSAGDSVLAEFLSVVEAVNCALEIQKALKVENTGLPPERRMEFRIGINLGDVMVEGEQIYGDGVNVAARLENLAEPGGVCISGTVHEQVRDKLAVSYEDRGEQAVKNIARPVHVWRVVPGAKPAPGRLPRKYWRSGVLSLTGLAIAAAAFVLVQHLSLKPPHTSVSVPPAEKPALALPSIPSIAVLPFTNLSGDPQQEYFSDGISAQLIEELSRLPGLFVIARNSSFAYKGKTVGERAVGRELGVKYLVEGTVRKASDQVRISVALIDASSGTEMWTAHYDRPFKDVLAVQDEIVGKVVTTLGLVVTGDQLDAPRWGYVPPTDNLEAFDDLLRANNYSWRFTKDDNAMERRWLEKALALDPKLSAAYSMLGWTYFFDAYFQWTGDPAANVERSIELGQKALLFDDSNCGALALLSNDYQFQQRFDLAIAEGERAITVSPNCSMGYGFLAVALNAAGKPAEALGAVEKAIRLDPAGYAFYAGVTGEAYMLMGRYEEAIPSLQRAVDAPNALWFHLALAIAYTELGRGPEARAQASEVMRIDPSYTLPSLEKAPYSAVPFLAGKDLVLQRRFDADLRKAGLK